MTTTINTSYDTIRSAAQALRAALVALAVVALLTAAFFIGRVSAPSTTVSPAQSHLQAPAVSAGSGLFCGTGTRLVAAC